MALSKAAMVAPRVGGAESAKKLVAGRDWERVKGIEPSYAAWEAAVLPLNYTRKENAE